MIPDMVAVRVRHKSERLSRPWVEPKAVCRQFETTMEPDINQASILIH